MSTATGVLTLDKIIVTLLTEPTTAEARALVQAEKIEREINQDLPILARSWMDKAYDNNYPALSRKKKSELESDRIGNDHVGTFPVACLSRDNPHRDSMPPEPPWTPLVGLPKKERVLNAKQAAQAKTQAETQTRNFERERWLDTRYENFVDARQGVSVFFDSKHKLKKTQYWISNTTWKFLKPQRPNPNRENPQIKVWDRPPGQVWYGMEIYVPKKKKKVMGRTFFTSLFNTDVFPGKDRVTVELMIEGLPELMNLFRPSLSRPNMLGFMQPNKLSLLWKLKNLLRPKLVWFMQRHRDNNRNRIKLLPRDKGGLTNEEKQEYYPLIEKGRPSLGILTQVELVKEEKRVAEIKRVLEKILTNHNMSNPGKGSLYGAGLATNLAYVGGQNKLEWSLQKDRTVKLKNGQGNWGTLVPTEKYRTKIACQSVSENPGLLQPLQEEPLPELPELPKLLPSVPQFDADPEVDDSEAED